MTDGTKILLGIVFVVAAFVGGYVLRGQAVVTKTVTTTRVDTLHAPAITLHVPGKIIRETVYTERKLPKSIFGDTMWVNNVPFVDSIQWYRQGRDTTFYVDGDTFSIPDSNLIHFYMDTLMERVAQMDTVIERFQYDAPGSIRSKWQDSILVKFHFNSNAFDLRTAAGPIQSQAIDNLSTQYIHDSFIDKAKFGLMGAAAAAVVYSLLKH